MKSGAASQMVMKCSFTDNSSHVSNIRNLSEEICSFVVKTIFVDSVFSVFRRVSSNNASCLALSKQKCSNC